MQKRIFANRYLVLLVSIILISLCPSKYALSQSAKGGYSYNLKNLLEETQENLEKVEQEIENREKEARIRMYFEKGNELYEEGKLKEAKSQWQKALKISKDPKMREYIKKAEIKAKEEKLAREKEQQEMRKRLQLEERERIQAEKEKERQLLLQQKELQRKQKEEEIARRNEERKRQKQIEAEAKEKERQLNKKARAIYNEAVSLYRSKDYWQAQLTFKQVSDLIPHYARTDYYVKRIAQDIQKAEERKEEIARKEREKRQRLEQEHLAKEKRISEQEALKKEMKLKKEKEQREKEAQMELRKAAEQQEKAYVSSNRKIESLYKKAVSLYNKGQLRQSKTLFFEILSLDPTDPRALDYIDNKIPNRIKQQENAE